MEKCPLCGDITVNNCPSIDLLANQAKTGNFKNSDCTGSGGKYWPRGEWADFMRNIQRHQECKDCPLFQELLKHCEQITREKEAAQEIV